MKQKFRLTNIARYVLYTLIATFIFTACDNSLDGKILKDENGQEYKVSEGIGDTYFIRKKQVVTTATDTTVVWK